MKILALGAHPDDLEIYCFGSLLAWQAMGAEITVAVATDGAAGGVIPDGSLSEIRQAESTKALSPISKNPHFLGFSDGELLPNHELIDAVRLLIAKEAPDLVVTHAPNDYHADHRALSTSVSHAAGFTTAVLYMDTPSGTGFHPTHYIETTKFASAKLAAIRCHVSQNPERYVAVTDRQSAFRADQCNALPGVHAEAFRFEPRFPFADIRAYLPPAPPIRSIRARISESKPI